VSLAPLHLNFKVFAGVMHAILHSALLDEGL